MKKTFFTILLLCILFFYACNTTTEAPEPTQVPTVEPTQTPSSVLTQEPTAVPTQTPIENQETPEIQETQNNQSKRGNIPFTDNQLYAVAYLGYETIEDMNYYQENYLDEENVPTYYFSGGEYYLIIPRYEDMEVRLYRNDLVTMGKSLVQEREDANPFIVQCNISDIFPDVTVELTYQGETVEFSPYISLKDGSVQVGDRGLDITKQQVSDVLDSQQSSQSEETSNPVEDGWVSLTGEEITWFNEQFFNTDGDVRRNDFLNCTYTDVKSISIYDIFYNLSEEISAEEKKALRGSEIDFGVDYQKLTVPYMDGILQEYMNTSFGEIAKVDLDYYLYFEEFDAYFGSHGDTNYSSVEVKSGTKDGNGTVKLQYLRREDGKEYVVTLKAHANGYYFVSNCEVE